jgi:hypothetical protein
VILEYVSVSASGDERVLDTLTIDDATGAVLASTTGRGVAIVDMLVRRYGRLAPVLARTWSNGYVLLREVGKSNDAT